MRCYFQTLKYSSQKLWMILQILVNWNPGFLTKFRYEGCKELYVEFLYTNYEGQLIGMFLVNMIFEVCLIAFQSWKRVQHIHITFAAISIAFHVGLIILKLWKRIFFKKISYLAVSLVLVLFLLFAEALSEFNSSELSLIYGLSYLLNVMIYLQNSTSYLYRCFVWD